MLTRDDLIDIFVERLTPRPMPSSVACRVGERGRPAAGATLPPASKQSRLDVELPGRKFLSEYDIRKQLTADAQVLRIPKESIISPLAADWLILRRVKIIRQ